MTARVRDIFAAMDAWAPPQLAYDWTISSGGIERSSAVHAALLPGSEFARGDLVWVTVTPSDGRSTGTPVTSDPVEIARGLRRQLESPFLSIEVDGDLLLIPRESIKYMQISPAPPTLPEATLTGAELIN